MEYEVVRLGGDEDTEGWYEDDGEATEQADKLYRFTGYDFEVRDEDGETIYSTRSDR